MKKVIAIVLLICFSALSCPVFCLSSGVYQPYEKTEFPKWALDLRRADCIFFGGLPIIFPAASIAMNLAGRDASYMETLGIACSISAVSVVLDYIIGVISEN